MHQKMKKALYMALGFLFILLALIGVFLPLLPTTPFLILAAYFFSKSSDKWHQWLLANKLFGPLLYKWETQRCMPNFAKVLSISMLFIFGGYSILTISLIWVKVLALLLIAYATYFILHIKSCLPDETQL